MKAESGKPTIKWLWGIALLACLLTPPVRAAVGAMDNVPAATLLLPYFEVDVTGNQFGTYIFTVHNTSADPKVAHVTLWTDVGIPTFGFDIYLAGKDLVDVELRAVFAGIVPHTSRTLSNVGADSTPNIAFTGCDALLPAVRLSEQQVLDLRQAHQGLASGIFTGNCGAAAHGDGMARGYITIDVVNRCSLKKFPGSPADATDPAYFVSGGAGIATNENVLWGEYRIVDMPGNQAHGDLLVAIEAADFLTSGYTFYGRRVNGDGSDNRERLPLLWEARHIAGGPFQEAAIQIWRDPMIRTPWPCGGPAPSIPHGEVIVFDEEENPSILTGATPSIVPLAASLIPLSVSPGLQLPPGFEFGFIFFDLRLGAGAGADLLFHGLNQSHVSTIHKSPGRFGGVNTAWPVDAVGGLPHP